MFQFKNKKTRTTSTTTFFSFSIVYFSILGPIPVITYINDLCRGFL